jgi:hypothetical protein
MFCLLGAGNFNLMLILRLKALKCNDPCMVILHSSRTFLEHGHGVVQEFIKNQRNFTSYTKIRVLNFSLYRIWEYRATSLLLKNLIYPKNAVK